MKKQKIYAQHAENNEWSNNTAFYRDELHIMENRLGEIASKNTSKELLKKVEHFQNQILIHRQRLDELKHGINNSERSLQNAIRSNPVAISHRRVEDHVQTRKDMEALEKSIAALRSEFIAFLSPNM